MSAVENANASVAEHVDGVTREVAVVSEPIANLIEAVGKVVVGQREMVEGLIIGMLCDGHVLLEGVPGLAKTLTVSTLAAAIHADFKRIQFTPDLLPADLLGTLIYNPKDGTFTPRRGPIFANIVLADEINRAPAKVQSALLESMQERQVTIGDTTYPLPSPFLVLATQNPIEQEGTYPLPEAQVDRFMLKLKVGYPSRDEERLVLDRMATIATVADSIAAATVVTPEQIVAARAVVDKVHVEDPIKDYIVDLIHASRNSGALDPLPDGTLLSRLIDFGASPRATIALLRAAKAHAFLAGRGYVTPDDVKSVALPVLRHRVVLSYEAEARGLDGDRVVSMLLGRVAVP
jgi:MoxR-like ATPase